MRKFILLTFIIASLLSCTSRRQPKPFTSDMLASQVFSIHTDKDTLLRTLHGAIISITSGSFNLTGKAKIEIKEAFTPAEIFAAGLNTESNGRPLRSGGMIYINATIGGKQTELIKPVKISIPNSYYDSAMQIFKGVQTDSTGINWTDPQPTDSTPQSKQWETGKALFKSKCASCHSIFKPLVGPALMNLENRGPWIDRKHIYAWIKNPPLFMQKDSYTQKLKSRYRSMMVAFPDMPDPAIDAILDYIKNESNRPGAMQEEAAMKIPLKTDSTGKLSYELGKDTSKTPDIVNTRPCKDDTFYLPVPKADQSFFQNALFPPADTTFISPPVTNNPSLSKPETYEGLRKGFNDPNPTNGMYDFEIRTFGWYNVDAYVDGYVGSSRVKVWAQVQVEFDITLHVYLFCPRNKMLSVSNFKEGNKYSFDKINGTIPLFLSDKAILFAFGSKDDKMFYGISEFRISGEQVIQVKVKETTEKEMREALQARQLEGIDLGIEKKEQRIIQNYCDNDWPVKDTIAKK